MKLPLTSFAAAVLAALGCAPGLAAENSSQSTEGVLAPAALVASADGQRL
jgi:hypothetical protein